MLKQLIDRLTGFHNLQAIPSKLSSELGNITEKPRIKTINPHFINIVRDDKYIKEIAQERAKLDGVLSSTDIIKDTFKTINNE